MAPTDEENPFIAFRKFADNQMSSFLHKFLGFPTTQAAQPSNNGRPAYDENKRRPEFERFTQALQRGDENPWAVMKDDDGEEAVEIPVKKYKERRDIDDADDTALRCRHAAQVLAFLRRSTNYPVFGTSGVFPNSQVSGSSLPLAQEDSSKISDRDDLTALWPMSYVLFDPYSPLQLEQQGRFRDHGIKWRDAFEDLLALQNGKDKPSQSECRKHFGSADWVESMFERGIFNEWGNINHRRPTLQDAPRLSTDVSSQQPENDAEEDSMTELDLYKCFLAAQYPSTSDEPVPQSPTPSTPPTQSSPGGKSEVQKPSIISTLTTTERKVLPDGTTHTRVSLKQRFADGREESSETVHTIQGTQTEPTRNTTGDLLAEQAEHSKQERNKKGWFWS
ncbi:hypothetical protein MMC06_000695 [Schaereria dolodes]|nr:hypothetical protein [Schaereria dolodes]